MKVGNVTLTSSKNTIEYTFDLFVAKISADGSVVFAQSAGTADDNNCLPEWGSSVTTDNPGNVYVSGRLVHKVFKPASSCSCGPSTITAVAYCVYVAKFSATGAKISEKKFFNSQASPADCGRYMIGTGIRSDGTNVYLTGTTFGSVAFGNTTLSSGSIDNAFLIKMEGTLNTIWAKPISNSTNRGGGVLLDGNDVYLTGTFSNGTISFGGPSLSTTSPVVYLARYSSTSGNCSWAVTSGVLNSKAARVIKLSNGNLAMLLVAPPQPSISPTYFGIKEFSTSDGSNVNSTVASISSPINTAVENFGSTPDGYFYAQNLKGSYDFAGATISSTQSLSSDYSDMVLVEYTTPAPPIVSEAQIVQKSPLHKIDLYPNPASDQITIRTTDNKALGSVKIYDVTGKVLYQKFIAGSQLVVDISKFSGGIYYVKADELTVKFIKQ